MSPNRGNPAAYRSTSRPSALAQRPGALVGCVLLALGAGLGGCGSDDLNETPPGAGGAGSTSTTAATGSLGGAGTSGGSTSTGDGGGASQGGGSTGGAAPCGYGESLCGDACIPTAADPANCGGCGIACPSDQVCVSNACADACPSALSACGGTCVDFGSDNAHCGGCDKPCPPGQGCSEGACEAAVAVGPAPGKCDGGGPPIVVEMPGGKQECVGQIADTLSYALCACDDVGLPVLTSTVLVDAFDSTKGPYVPFGLGGSLGANDEIRMGSKSAIYGDLRTSAGAGLKVLGDTDVHQSLHVAESLFMKNVLNVSLDAAVGGPISADNPAVIGGTLHTPDCGAVPSDVTAAACVSGPVDVAPPCACDPAELYPIADVVSHYANPANNDNALIGLDPSALAGPGGPNVVVLPCGYYHFDRITKGDAVTIHVDGHTAIFVSGSISSTAPVTFSLTPNSTLDVFVGGTIYSGGLKIGSAAYPAKTRFYVAGVAKEAGAPCESAADCWSTSCGGGQCGSGEATPKPFSVLLQGKSDLHGGFYAPWGAFVTGQALEMYGAMLVKDFHATSETVIHYDAAFVKESLDCAEEGQGGGDGAECDSCGDCGFQACVNGKCGPCTTSADCCQPLYCVKGECTPGPK